MATRRGDTLIFQTPPVIAAHAAVGGKKEGEGPLAAGFDALSADNRFGQSGWEAAETWWDGADTSRLFPPVTPTTAEGNAISNSVNAISTYASEMMYKFIMGEESIDGFDTYLEELRGMGLDTVLQIKDQQVARYFAR